MFAKSTSAQQSKQFPNDLDIVRDVKTLRRDRSRRLLMEQLENRYLLAVAPTSILIDDTSPIAPGGMEEFDVTLTLPADAIADKVDVFLLFDDTGSFASQVPLVAALFPDLISDLEMTLPTIDFGFGVGRFEDYGGPGRDFSNEYNDGRPFTLNQPIITEAFAGSAADRDSLIATALSNTAPGFGGDGPESSIAEGLFQVATGVGFDGDGNGNTTDSGAASGELDTQVDPGPSGDVPAFSSRLVATVGTEGGVGYRADALKLAILATGICAVSAHDDPIPAIITGAGGSSEPVSAFACSSVLGSGRYGYVGDAKSSAENTVPNAVVPSGAATVQETVDALNTLGVRVLGLGPGAVPTTSAGPSFNESVFLSAIARLTGAVDSSGDALVFNISGGAGAIADAIVEAVTTTATTAVDVTLDPTALPTGLSFECSAPSPCVVEDVAPGGSASFTAQITSDGTQPLAGAFDIRFIDEDSGAVLGIIPVTVDIDGATSTGEVINGMLSLAGLSTSYNPGDPRAAAGVFTIVASFTNVSATSANDIFFETLVLSGGNLVLNADGGPGGVGSEVTVPGSALGGDELLTPGESFIGTFEIGLVAPAGFTFLVNVFGIPTSPLHAGAVAAIGLRPEEVLSTKQLEPIVADATELWRTAGADVTTLDQIDVRVRDLPGDLLGLAYSDYVVIDHNAAGHGWSTAGEPDQIDLLTAVSHELGHVLGFQDVRWNLDRDSVMSTPLVLGMQRLPSASDLSLPTLSHSHDGVTAAHLELGEFDPSHTVDIDAVFAGQQVARVPLAATEDDTALDELPAILVRQARPWKPGFEVTRSDSRIAIESQALSDEGEAEKVDRFFAELEEPFALHGELVGV